MAVALIHYRSSTGPRKGAVERSTRYALAADIAISWANHEEEKSL